MPNTVTKRWGLAPLVGAPNPNLQWTCPPGVTYVRVTTRTPLRAIKENTYGFIDPYGSAYTMGSNTNGQMGDATVVSKSTPTLVVMPAGTQVIYMSSNEQSSFFITQLGQLYVTGQNTQGQLGNGAITNLSTPTNITPSVKYWKVKQAGASTMLLSTSGQVYMTGFMGSAGIIGNGTAGTSTLAVSVPTLVAGGYKFSDINIAPATVCFGFSFPSIYGWGANNNGQLGTNDVVYRSSPTLVVAPTGVIWTGVPMIGQDSSGLNNSAAAIGSLGTFPANTFPGYMWGANNYGQLGVGDTTARSTPTLVLGGLNWSQIIPTGDGTVIGLTTAGVPYGWGLNPYGQAGVGDNVPRSSPTLMVGSLKFTKIWASGNNLGNGNACYGLTAAGQIYAWGDNTTGQLGVGDTVKRSSPTLVGASSLIGVTIIDLAPQAGVLGSGGSVYAISTTGQVYSWGQSPNGETGQSSVITVTTPQPMGLPSTGNIPFANTLDNLNQFKFPVVAASAYNVAINSAYQGAFGNFPVGQNVSELSLQYEQ